MIAPEEMLVIEAERREIAAIEDVIFLGGHRQDWDLEMAGKTSVDRCLEKLCPS